VNIDAAQYQSIVTAAFGQPGELAAGDAELIIAIAQLAVAADRVDDPEERALFRELAAHVYTHAKQATEAPDLGPVDDEDQRQDQLRSHAGQLAGKPAAALAYAIAYVLVISDLELAPEEDALLETLGKALGLTDDRVDELAAVVSEAITPMDDEG